MSLCLRRFNCYILVTIFSTLSALAQPCLSVQGLTNKTVQCGATWTFDSPIVSTCCASGIVTSTGVLTNALINSTGIFTNGTCPQLVTQTWSVTDGCGNTTNCSQTVTITGCCSNNCLQVQCPNDKTVPCGAAWTFDSPVVSTCCTNQIVTSAGTLTNVLVTSNGILTNGVCPKITYTKTWTIMDGCGNSTNCSQNVTVTGCCSSNCFQVQCPTNKTVACGTTWTFDQPIIITCCTSNIPGTIIPTNVLVILGSTVTNGTCPQVTITQSWMIMDGCGNSTNCSQTVTVIGCCSSNCFQIQCPANKTVACGTAWTFDRPLVTTCCTSNVPGTTTNLIITPTGQITNGACPQLTITRTWSITDGCGDITNCSQSVTVTGCCTTNCFQIQCPANKTVACGTGWTFDRPLVTTCCSNNVPGTTTNLLIAPTGLFTNGACPQQNITQTWSITDGCGDTTNCSQTVTVTGCCITNCFQIQSPTNKSVLCSALWTFDQPIVTSCCTSNIPGTTTNVLVIPVGTTTNGACPSVTITQNWMIIDGCGNSTNVSQSVTVIGCCNCLQVQCATNKTVQCGTAWTFNPPVATTCCSNHVAGTSTNLLITVVSSVTNGVCPKIATRVWRVVDGCGNTNTCTQQVTMADTTPPTIVCPTNAVVVALNSNCMLVIPPISVTATDNCTPPCSLVYSQSPPAGTIVSVTVTNVTITVTDLCGNSNSCVVTVIGLPKTPPVVTCPSVMTVTNCLVPCVPVTASDNCCPTKWLTISQSPPCGTLLGPGVTSVTITVTDCHGNVTVKVVHLIASPGQSFLNALTNTGVGPNGTLLPDGVVDPYYLMSAVPAGMPSDYAGNSVAVSDICHLTGTACAYLNGYVHNICYEYVPWSLPPDAAYVPAASKWIAPNYTNNGCDPAGSYTYTLNFTLPGTANPATATISGRWAADNTASMKLNGVTVAVPSPGLSSWTPFSIPAGSPFVVGANSIKFIVNNSSIWTGLRVEFTNAYSACATCAPPSVIWITPAQSLQVGSTATFNVIANGSTPLTYQWLQNNVSIPGATSPTLQIPSIGLGNAGLYTVIISNPCGVVTQHVQLTVTRRWWWQWGWWNVASVASPLAATVGPDLELTGSTFATTYGINTGSTEDFGLPAPGGQIANVMEINPEAGGTIQLPPITAPGTTNDPSYTVVMDYYQPDTSYGTPSTLFQSAGPDGITLSLDETNYLHLSGSDGGVPFDGASAQPMPVNTWMRLALVVDSPQDGGTATLKVIGNGQVIIIIHPCICCIIPFNPSTINWNLMAPTLFSAAANADNPNGVFFISSLQFHDIALPDDMLAGIGSPESGPTAGNQTSVGAAPMLSASVAGNGVTLTWGGSAYVLQESTDLSNGQWANAALPFTESTDTSGGTTTSATVEPEPSVTAKFYRLVFRP